MKKNHCQCGCWSQSQQGTSGPCASCAATSCPEETLRNIETALAARLRDTQLTEDEREEERETNDDMAELDEEPSPFGLGGYREHLTPLDLAVWDAVRGVAATLHERGVNEEWIIMAIHRLYFVSCGTETEHWTDFQEEGKIGFEYCLYGEFYHGHFGALIAEGKCVCRTEPPPILVNKTAKCIRVKRCQDGILVFNWGQHIGLHRDLGRWER
ncbi:hypothetical protein B0T09DRAFT_329543 [Sordaria sp. MPI-SDFR-AT-0083]|nr:hypothetical protein B0T09DRAFT_329543 [Sordaria sp. MPI-SDFR-AT-0083]